MDDNSRIPHRVLEAERNPTIRQILELFDSLEWLDQFHCHVCLNILTKPIPGGDQNEQSQSAYRFREEQADFAGRRRGQDDEDLNDVDE